MPKHKKKTPDYPVDSRGTRNAFLEYCNRYLDFVEVDDTSSGFRGNNDLRFNKPGTVDEWIAWWVENEDVRKPEKTYSEFIQGLEK